MILRRQASTSHSLFLLSLLTCFISTVLAQDNSTFNCLLTVDSFKYDLTGIKGEHTLSRTRESPPSTMVDSVRFDLCSELKALDAVPEGDQCSSETRVCLTTVNKKKDQSDRIVSVIPIAQTPSLNPTYTMLSEPKGLSLQLHGPSYPHHNNSTLTPQSLNLTILCSTEASDPKFVGYDGAELQIEWSVPAGCAFKGDESPGGGGGGGEGGDKNGSDGDKPNESKGSGIGWFFLMLLIGFIAYLGLGAYYNYTTYGASGLDLIPHRDFWKEVPYMLSDVVSHLCSSVRPRRAAARGGYIAV